MPKPELVVVGSLNIDYIASVSRLPVAGETVPARNLIQRFGGKGANQAVAAARQGARVCMVGCVGADAHGCAYRLRMRKEGIQVSALSSSSRALTGTALIAVDEQGENIIIVAPGANGHLNPAAVCRQASRIESAALVLLQFEVPMPTIIETVRLANRASVPVVLNPSPWRDGFAWGRCNIDTLIANTLEARTLLGLSDRSLELAVPGPPPARGAVVRRHSGRMLSSIQRVLEQKGVQRLIITRGAKPTLCIDAEGASEIPTLRVKPVDTVGAGDAFAGTYAAARIAGADFRTAVRLANCAGALATLKSGAQESIPSRASTERAACRLGLQGPRRPKGLKPLSKSARP